MRSTFKYQITMAILDLTRLTIGFTPGGRFPSRQGLAPGPCHLHRAFGGNPSGHKNHCKTMGTPWENGGLMGFNAILWDFMGFTL